MKKVPHGVIVASPEMCETADYCLCLPASWAHAIYFNDNQHGRCSACGCAVMFRPYNPKTPKKLCIRCFTAKLESDGASPDLIGKLKKHIEESDAAALAAKMKGAR